MPGFAMEQQKWNMTERSGDVTLYARDISNEVVQLVPVFFHVLIPRDGFAAFKEPARHLVAHRLITPLIISVRSHYAIT